MFSMTLFFASLLLLFAFVGSMRLWQREIIATAAIVFGLFVLGLIGVNRLMNLIPDPPPGATPEQINSTRFWRFVVASAPFVIITALGYAGPLITRQFSPGRFGVPERIRIENGIVGFLIGGLNGYLVVSTLAWLAYQALVLGPEPFPLGASPPTFVPPPDGWNSLFFIQSAPPVWLTGPLLYVTMIILIMFVFIAFI